jgi:hypothetical protein
MKKVVRFTESELVKLVSKIISEDNKIMEKPVSIKTIKSNFPNAKNRNYKVTSVKGKPSIKKDNKDLLLTVGMSIKPTDFLKFKNDDKVMMSSTSPEDMVKGKPKYFQQVELSIGDNGKLELFVYSD